MMDYIRSHTMYNPFNRATEDVGNIIEFGHVNLRVADQQQATIFYAMGLGLTRDPYQRVGIDNAWMNVGSSQFHLPMGRAEVLRGVVGLVMPDLDGLLARLGQIAPLLTGTQFGFERHGDVVLATCPWGNRIRVHAPDTAQFGPLRLGMPYVEVDCAPGTAAGIARFYTEVLGALASAGEDGRGAFARISAGLNGRLLFRETARPLPAYDGHRHAHGPAGATVWHGWRRAVAERRPAGVEAQRRRPGDQRPGPEPAVAATAQPPAQAEIVGWVECSDTHQQCLYKVSRDGLRRCASNPSYPTQATKP